MLRYSLMLLALGACGGLDHDIEDRPAADETVIVFAPGAKGPYSQVTSDDDGVYQINLVAGDYTLCTYSCTEITVPDHDRVRYDWTSGPGGGLWSND